MMRTITRRVLPIALALLATLAGVARAQVSTTTGAIRGLVSDEAGQPLPGAAVTAVNQETGLTRGAQAGDDGIYVIRLLPPGTYRVTARRIGQELREVANVRVTVGATTPMNINLRAAAVQLAEVRVTAGAGQIDVAEGGVKQTVSQEEIANLPTLGRDFTDFITLSGLVSPAPEVTTGGQFSIAGQRPSQTNVQIDGVDANNAFFGENRGGSRIPFAFSLESIREFQVVTNGYDVEYGNYAGGVVNIVTRGGTNRFRGSAYGNFRDKSLTAKDFDGVAAENFSAQQYAVRVEGPLVRDKLFYLLSVDGQRRREPFRSISPAFLRGSGEAEEKEEADSLERFFDILETVYGVRNAAATYGNWEIADDVLTLFGRLDWTLNDRHRLSVRNNFADHENADEAGSFAFRTGRSQAESFKDRSNSFVSELTSTLLANVANVLRVQYATEDRPRIGNELRPELNVRIHSGADNVEYGGAFISFNNRLVENKLQLVDNVTLDVGQHTFKLGTNNIFSHIENDFWLNGSGAYTFNSLADFEAKRPVRFNRNVRADGQPPRATFDAQEYSVYAQDEWQVTPRLLAIAGLRYDVQRYGDRPGRVIDVERAFGLTTGIAPVDDNNISPRLSLTFDRTGDASEVWRAGAGLFYGRVPFVIGSNVASTEVPLLVLECAGSIDEGAADAPPPIDYANWSPSGADNPARCAGATGLRGVPEYTFWHGDFELPETFKANLGYERRLSRGTRASLDLLFSESSKLYTVRNVNLRDPQFQLAAEGGRRVFVPEERFTPSQSAGTDRLRNTDFGNIFVNYNDGVARSFAATLNVAQRLFDSAVVRGSYTYTWAYDNSSYFCCTSLEGFRDTRVGALGPNIIGEIGDRSGGWGPTNFVRNHTFVLAGIFRLPYGFQVAPKWRLHSGTPWSPEQSGDLNGDGERFNDRPFIYRPQDLPVFVAPSDENPTATIAEHRQRYADYLAHYDCVSDYVGEIIPRGSCRQPWFNQLDLSIRKRFAVTGSQSAELSVDLFNVLNGISSDWGRNRVITGSARNLLLPQQYNAATGQIEYTVPTTFGDLRQVGSGLIQQFSAQIGLRYSF